jgi:Tfp pilus assembly protein PilN
MKPYNLAETKIGERNRCRREVNRRLTVVAALVGLCLVVAAASFFCRLSITAKATRLRSDLADVQQRCVKVKQEMAEVKLRSAQRNWQKELTDGSKQWLRVLGDVMGRLPEDAWISRIENSPQNSSFTLEGGTSSYESVSAYMNRLRRAPGAAEVRLSNSRVTTGANSTFVEFALQIKIRAVQAQPAGTQPVQPAGVPEVQGSS